MFQPHTINTFLFMQSATDVGIFWDWGGLRRLFCGTS
jgi:hypothetical protein